MHRLVLLATRIPLPLGLLFEAGSWAIDCTINCFSIIHLPFLNTSRAETLSLSHFLVWWCHPTKMSFPPHHYACWLNFSILRIYSVIIFTAVFRILLLKGGQWKIPGSLWKRFNIRSFLTQGTSPSWVPLTKFWHNWHNSQGQLKMDLLGKTISIKSKCNVITQQTVL